MRNNLGICKRTRELFTLTHDVLLEKIGFLMTQYCGTRQLKWTHEPRPPGRGVKLESEPLYSLPIMPPRTASAAVGMWSTRQRCPTCPQQIAVDPLPRCRLEVLAS